MARDAAAPRVEAFLEMLAAERGAAALTISAYATDLDDLARFLEADIAQASSEDLRRYFAARAEAGMGARAAARRLSAFRQFFHFLVVDLSNNQLAGFQATSRLGVIVPFIKPGRTFATTATRARVGAGTGTRAHVRSITEVT